ncbi:MAG TPA: META domain-containing protein [Microvirga sp.]|jgi:heat shock protein HslJ|nr:META domain-containing protein [Microvirga sp.]
MTALRLATLLSALALAASATGVGAQQPPSGQRGQAAPAAKPASQPASPVPQPRREKMFDVGSTWIAVSLNGKPFPGERPSFTLDKQYQVRGFGGCNTFSAVAYPLKEQGIAVSPILPRRQACDRAVMSSEQAFFAALRYAEKWDQQGATLILKSPNGELRFERAL